MHSEFRDRHPFNELLDILEDALEDGIITDDEKEDLLWFCNKLTTENIYYDVITSDMQRLNGIIHGIIADKKIADEEVIQLKKWLMDNDHLASVYPYDELTALLVDILKDKVITNSERKLLERHLIEYVDTSKMLAYSEAEIEKIKKTITVSGICALDPEVEIEDATFCFTGKSSRAQSRTHLQNLIESLGGVFSKGLTKKANYLVVGNEGNPCWAYACYGRKIEKAIDYRSKGQNLVIVHENDFWDMVDDI